MCSLCKLIEGEFPVKHHSDYIGPSDKKAFAATRPKLPCILEKVVLNVTVVADHMNVLSLLEKSRRVSANFETRYNGIGFSACVQDIFKCLNDFSHFHLNEIIFSSALVGDNELKSCLRLPGLTANGMLWLNTDFPSTENFYTSIFSKFLENLPLRLVVTQLNQNLLATLVTLKIRVSAFSLLPLNQQAANIRNSRDLFNTFLKLNTENLDYMRLRYCLTLIPLGLLQKFTNLRVLSISANTTATSPLFDNRNSAAQVLVAMQNLYCLEYFEWSEPLNIITKDVLALYNLLTRYLPNLVHWHWTLSYLLLFTTDLENSLFKPLEPILRILMLGKLASAWCSTYKFALNHRHFKCWMEKLRPDVCFHNNSNCQSFSGTL